MVVSKNRFLKEKKKEEEKSVVFFYLFARHTSGP